MPEGSQLLKTGTSLSSRGPFELKVVHIISDKLSGGAARGALWLHYALKGIGVESSILSSDDVTDADSCIYTAVSTKRGRTMRMVRAGLDRLPLRLYKSRKQTNFSTGFVGYPIHKHQTLRSADIVNLHWINEGFVGTSTLKKIGKPMVWTLRDMWPMTGGCHYALECVGYQNECGRCPQLGSKSKFDISRMILRYKAKALREADITMVGISSWIAGCARESRLFRDRRVEVINNTVDGNQFKPIEKGIAREILGLPDKTCILVGAQDPTQYYKGMNEFVAATRYLSAKRNLHIVVFGTKNDGFAADPEIDQTFLGYLHDTPSLRLAYSAADVFVAPSRAEAFGKTLAEAMACGTPVVAFDATGPKDIVDHKINGYLARPFDPHDLASGIEWVIRHPHADRLSENARRKCNQMFAPGVIARKYLDLYTEILSSPSSQRVSANER